jgi:hypothetical protein
MYEIVGDNFYGFCHKNQLLIRLLAFVIYRKKLGTMRVQHLLIDLAKGVWFS